MNFMLIVHISTDVGYHEVRCLLRAAQTDVLFSMAVVWSGHGTSMVQNLVHESH